MAEFISVLVCAVAVPAIRAEGVVDTKLGETFGFGKIEALCAFFTGDTDGLGAVKTGFRPEFR